MAELDVSGFVQPERQFLGLYKLGETLQAQQAAKRKDAQEKETKKKILNKFVADINPDDYMTGTPEDPVITQKIFDVKNDAYKFVLENPGADQADLEYHVNNLVRDVAASSKNLKQTKLNADKYYESVKDNKSIDKQKFYDNYMKNAYYNEDGSLKDLAKIDSSQDFLTPTLNSDIYNTEGFNNAISNMATNTFSDRYKVRTPSGTTREANLSVTSPTFYQPSLDDKGVLAEQKFIPKHGYATDNNQRIQIPKTDLQGNVIVDANTKKPVMEDMKIVQDDAWQYFTTNPETKGYLNVAMQKYAKDNNLPVTSTQVDNYGRNLAYKIMESSPNVKGSYKEEEQKLAPITKNTFNIGGSGDASKTIKDEYTKLANKLKEGQAKNDKVAEYISQGKSDNQIKQDIGATQSTINRIRKGGSKTYGAPFTELRPPVQVDVINKLNATRPNAEDKYSAKDIYISTDENGQITAYSAKEGEIGTPLMPLDYTSLNLGVGQVGKTEKQETIKIGDKKEKSKKDKDPLGIF